jgi:uncharacterized protein YcfJ
MITRLKRPLASALGVAAAAIATHAAAQVTFYQDEAYRGPAFTADRDIGNLQRFGFNDRASSIVIQGGPWQVCEDVRFEGRCVILRPGRYPSVSAMGLNDRISSVRPAGPDLQAMDRRGDDRGGPPRITFYEHEGFQGGTFAADGEVPNFTRYGFNDRASSIVIRGGNWQVCEDIRYNGRCVVLRPGRYPSVAEMGLNDHISSVRPVDGDQRAQMGYGVAPTYDFHRRNGERLYEANVTSVRAVVQTPQQQCWVEREQINSDNSQANVPAAIAGAVVGGILGHQVGGGSGKDVATALGAIGGAALGANVAQGGTRDVQRCNAPVGHVRPDYWDVTYYFNGQEHHVMMAHPPGRTVTVNDQGQPRA